MVANSNDDTFSLIDTNTGDVVQTVNVNPLPGSTVGSYPNAITMPDSSHDPGQHRPGQRAGGLRVQRPAPAGPVRGPAADRLLPGQRRLRRGDRQARRHQRQGHRRARPGEHDRQGPGHHPGDRAQHLRRHRVVHRVHDAEPGRARRATPTRCSSNNGWDQLLASHAAVELQRRAGGDPGAARLPVHDQARVPDHPREPHLRPGARRHRRRATATRPTRSSAPRSPRTRTPWPATYGLFDNFYDEGTLSADGHNWLVQADANDYIEREFGAFYRSYPAQGGDALAYQRDGFIWNAAETAGKSVKVYGEYNNFMTEPAGTTWSEYYQDSQILEGKATGPLPVPPSSVDRLRRHPVAQRGRLPPLPAVQPGHPGPVPDRHLAAVVREERADRQPGQPQPDLDAGRPHGRRRHR